MPAPGPRWSTCTTPTTASARSPPFVSDLAQPGLGQPNAPVRGESGESNGARERHDRLQVIFIREFAGGARGTRSPDSRLQRMAKMSSTVHGLAQSVPRIHLSTATSKRVDVSCGCHRSCEIHLHLLSGSTGVRTARSALRRCGVLRVLGARRYRAAWLRPRGYAWPATGRVRRERSCPAYRAGAARGR